MQTTATDNQSSSLADAMRADAADVSRRTAAQADQYLKDDFATGESHRWSGDLSTFEPYEQRRERSASQRAASIARARGARDAALARAMRKAKR